MLKLNIEYRVETFFGYVDDTQKLNDKLNVLAKDGWRIREMISTQGNNAPSSDQNLTFLFTRRTFERKSLQAGQALPRGVENWK